MEEIARLFDCVMTSLTRHKRLPVLTIPKDLDDQPDYDDDDAPDVPPHGCIVIDPDTFLGLKKFTQLMEVAALVSTLKRGILCLLHSFMQHKQLQ